MKAKFSLGDVIQYVNWETNEVWQGEIVGIMLSKPSIDGDRHIEYEIAVCGKRVIKSERDCYMDEVEARKEVIERLEWLIKQNERIIKTLEERRKNNA